MTNKNTIDFYKYWTTEAVKSDLDKKRNNFSVLISNESYDFNIGTVIRNSNAFLAKDVYIFGRKKWDRRGAVGTHHYQNLHHVKFVEDVDFAKFCVVGVDNVEGASPLEEFTWDSDKPYLMIFGQENEGIPQKLVDKCDRLLYIKQYGSVRSLNVGCASSIAMYDYCRKVVK